MDGDLAPSAGARGQARAACVRAGLEPDTLDPALLDRMALLAEGSPTLRDNARAMELAEQVFEYYARGDAPLSETEKTTVRVGSLLSDIGKTGPLAASLEQQRLVVRMFAVERVDDEQMSVARFFSTYFGADASASIALFASLDLDPNLTLRQFWNLHSTWTLELLQHSTVPPEAVAAAAAHHLLEHVNPRSIVADDDSFVLPFGSNLRFDRPEKLVILLDKYDAVRRRGRRDHPTAISYLRDRIKNNPRFGKDPEFHGLLDALDEVFASGAGELYSQSLRDSQLPPA